MFQYVKDAFLSLDILGMGSFLTLTALGIGISREVSDGNMETFMLTFFVWNLFMAFIITSLTQESAYYLVMAIVDITILMLPNGIKEIIIEKRY